MDDEEDLGIPKKKRGRLVRCYFMFVGCKSRINSFFDWCLARFLRSIDSMDQDNIDSNIKRAYITFRHMEGFDHVTKEYEKYGSKWARSNVKNNWFSCCKKKTSQNQ